jgi:DNA-binding beta-propeller fold protein YncE
MLLRFILTWGVASALLTGCVLPLSLSKGQDDTVPPVGAPGAIPQSGAGTEYYLYAIDPKNSPSSGEVHVYPLAGKHQREIAYIAHGLPAAHGIATDRAGNLYVAASSSKEVRVYAPLARRPFLTLKDRVGTNEPWGVAVSGTGDVAVTNNITLSPYRPSNVSFFHAGATHPYATFTKPDYEFVWDAYDDAGNLYVVGSSAHSRAVLSEIVGGGSGRKLQNLHAAGLSRGLGGVQVDAAGDVVVAQGTQLSVFAPHSDRLLRTIPFGREVRAEGLALTPSGTDFYIANDKLKPAQLWEYHYPDGGKPINKIHVVPQGHPPIVEVSGLAIGPAGAL